MNQRFRNLVIAALVPLGVLFIAFEGSQRERTSKAQPPATSPVGLSTGSPTPLHQENGKRSYSYALDLLSLNGLPPDLQPGTPVELWVTWRRGEAATQPERWVTGASFQRIAPAITPTGPDVAIIEIPFEARRKMVWADTYGLLTLFASSDR